MIATSNVRAMAGGESKVCARLMVVGCWLSVVGCRLLVGIRKARGRAAGQFLNQQPATSNQQPATSNQQPATSNQQPATSNQQPATSNLSDFSRRQLI